MGGGRTSPESIRGLRLPQAEEGEEAGVACITEGGAVALPALAEEARRRHGP